MDKCVDTCQRKPWKTQSSMICAQKISTTEGSEGHPHNCQAACKYVPQMQPTRWVLETSGYKVMS